MASPRGLAPEPGARRSLLSMAPPFTRELHSCPQVQLESPGNLRPFLQDP